MRPLFRSRTSSTPRAVARAASRRLDEGDTLVEVLIALMVLGTTTVALLIAFGTTLSASAQHRSLSNYNTVLASANSEVSSLVQQNSGAIFGTCPSPPSSLSAYPSQAALSANLPSPYTAQITGVAYWSGSSFTSACTSSNNTAPELITVTVTNTTTHNTYLVQVVVDDPSTVSAATGSSLASFRLVFVTQPSGATYNSPFAVQPVVEVEDKNGNLVNSDLSPVTITLSSGPSGALLSNCTGIESSGYITYTGCSINQLGTGYQLTASEPSGSSVIPAVSAPFGVSATQLNTPTITNVQPSTTTAGAINVTFTGSSNAPTGQTYTVKACTDAAMSIGCVAQTNFTSGSGMAFLIAGYNYYVQVTATGSTNYLPSTTPPSGPTMATVQLTAPSAITLAFGSSAGGMNVTFTGSSNAPTGQTYTVTACTNAGMTTGCVTNSNFTSGGQYSGLAFTVGSPGSTYFVQVVANASSGYLVSPASTQASQADTSQLGAPGTPTLTSSSTTSGVISATFTSSSGTAPSSYTATICTDAAMTQNCATKTNFTSGGQFTGLTQGTQYFVTITAVPSSSAFIPSTSPVSAAALATVQLNTPSTPVLAYGAIAGSINVTSTSSNAPAGQTYTVRACQDSAMTLNCMTNANSTSGSDLPGLAFTIGSAGGTYYVQVTANASTGYLVSSASTQSSHADTSQVGAPGTPSVATSATTAGAISVTFSSSSGVAPASYTGRACANPGMNSGCFGPSPITSGGLMTGLTQGNSYYAVVTAVPPSNAFVANTSATSATTAFSTVQLAPPGKPTVVSSATTAGAVTVTFTAPSPAAPSQAYTALACTASNMQSGCDTATAITSGGQITGLTPGVSYYVAVTASASSGYLVSPASAISSAATASIQLNAPGTPFVASSTTTAGALQVTFTPSPGAPGGQAYTALACTASNMQSSCDTASAITSGGQITGLIQGSYYYVTVTASTSPGYVASTSATSASSTLATVQMSAPTFSGITPSTTTTGQITVMFAAPTPVAPGQTYSMKVCTDQAMSFNCTVPQSVTPGTVTVSTLTPGIWYYVAITSPSLPGYLGVTTGGTGPTLATAQLAPPGKPTVVSSATTAGAVTVTFTAPSPAAPSQAYTALACTASNMQSGCDTATAITSGGQITGLTPGVSYYVAVTASASSGYLVSPASAISSAATASEIQLNAPGSLRVTPTNGPFGSTLQVTFSAPSPAAPSQTYTVKYCTNSNMSSGCVTTNPFTSGTIISGLNWWRTYYVTVTANASPGYLASAASSVVSAAP